MVTPVAFGPRTQVQILPSPPLKNIMDLSRRSENARVLSVVCQNKHKFNASGAVPIIGYYRHSFLIPTGPRASAAAAGAVSLKTPETAPKQDS